MFDVCAFVAAVFDWLHPLVGEVLTALGVGGSFEAEWQQFSSFVLSALSCAVG